MKRPEIFLFAVLAVVLGTAMHFVHHADFFNHYWGYVFPVRESVWEHMKMLLYPLIQESIYLMCRKKNFRALAGPMLVAPLAMAVQIGLFFSYFYFVGHEITIVDVIEYVVVMMGSTWVGCVWSDRNSVRRMWPIGLLLMVVMVVALAVLTYHFPNWILFKAM